MYFFIFFIFISWLINSFNFSFLNCSEFFFFYLHFSSFFQIKIRKRIGMGINKISCALYFSRFIGRISKGMGYRSPVPYLRHTCTKNFPVLFHIFRMSPVPSTCTFLDLVGISWKVQGTGINKIFLYPVLF